MCRLFAATLAALWTVTGGCGSRTGLLTDNSDSGTLPGAQEPPNVACEPDETWTTIGRAATLFDALHEIEDQLVDYYASQRRRFALSTTAVLGEWMSGVFATYVAVNLLGYPITFVEAFVIDSFVALVRSVFFFVPADLGTQEGAQVLICSGITGSPELGLALATIRRSRDLAILALGALFGTEYSLRRRGGLDTAAPSEPELATAPEARQQS